MSRWGETGGDGRASPALWRNWEPHTRAALRPASSKSVHMYTKHFTEPLSKQLPKKIQKALSPLCSRLLRRSVLVVPRLVSRALREGLALGGGVLQLGAGRAQLDAQGHLPLRGHRHHPSLVPPGRSVKGQGVGSAER